MTTAEIQFFALPRQCKLHFPVPVFWRFTPRGYVYHARDIHLFDGLCASKNKAE